MIVMQTRNYDNEESGEVVKTTTDKGVGWNIRFGIWLAVD
jgi:hypothetical protein